MDSVELFRKIGAGAKFDFKRFGKDAERFKVRINARSPRRGYATTHLMFSSPLFMCFSVSQELDAVGANGRQGSAEVEGIRWTSFVGGTAKGSGEANEDKRKRSLKRLKHLHQEKVNRIRHENRINVHGTDIPDPVATFEELEEEYQLDPRIIQNLRAAGFQTPTPIQMQAIPLMLHRREILACAPTGSGKTVAFCLPLLAHLRQPANKGFRALVISPTRELASQTHRELRKLSEGVGFRVHIIDKGADAAKKYGPKSARKFDILVTTPNRLIYLLKQDPPAMDLSSVEWLVVDESDKLFEEGKKGFREQLATIFLACTSPRVRRALFSATFALDVEQWCRLNLDNLVSVSIGQRNSAADTVEQELLFVGTENGKLLAMRDLIKKGFMPPMLVFVQSIERARELFHELVYEGINVDVIHADRTQQQRDNVVSSFRSGQIWVLICTALLARGIDFKGVNLVINYDFPTSAVEYIHRIGRTGRAGHRGKAVTFFTEDDKPLLRSIANVIKQAGCPVPDYMTGFKKIHSKMRRKLEKKPPRRTTIRTTPRCLVKRGGAKRNRRNKEEGDSAQPGASETSTS
ncbi:putative ATP-dependent RNA helicase DDX52 [Arapaima gigas]